MSTSRSHPPSPISPARFNLLKTQAINGDPNATSTLHLVVSYNNFLGLDDVLPVIYAHLSLRHLAQVKDTDGVVAMNARYALKMLAHGLDKSQQQPFPPNGNGVTTLETLCPPISSWIALFISSTHILDSPLLLREIGHIIPSLLRHTPLLHALRKEGRLLPLTMDTFLHLPSSSPARPDFQTAVLTALIAEAKLVPGHPALEHSMRALLASPARLPDVARALIRSLACDADTGEGKEKMMSLSSLRLSLSTIFYARSSIPSLRRALAVHGVLDVLCLAARRASKGLYHTPPNEKGTVGSCMCLLIQELSVFTRMAPRFVVRALSEGHLIDTLLRIERVVGGDEEHFEDQEDKGHLSAMIGGCLGYVQAFLVYRSVGRVCRRKIRYEGDCGVGGEVGRRYERLKEAVEIRTREGEVYERVEGRCVCVNPDCPSSTTEAAPKPRRCSGCLFAVYCSRACQKTHWANGHRTQCQVLDRARSSPSHSLHLPPSPLDLDMIYAMVQDDLTEHATLIERKLSSSGKSSTPRPGPLIVELDYSDGSRPRISIRPLDAFRRAVEESSVIEYTDEMWDHLLDRLGDRGGGGKYIAIMISGMWLVDLTTEERIRGRLYPVDVLPVMG